MSLTAALALLRFWPLSLKLVQDASWMEEALQLVAKIALWVFGGLLGVLVASRLGYLAASDLPLNAVIATSFAVSLLGGLALLRWGWPWLSSELMPPLLVLVLGVGVQHFLSAPIYHVLTLSAALAVASKWGLVRRWLSRQPGGGMMEKAAKIFAALCLLGLSWVLLR